MNLLSLRPVEMTWQPGRYKIEREVKTLLDRNNPLVPSIRGLNLDHSMCAEVGKFLPSGKSAEIYL